VDHDDVSVPVLGEAFGVFELTSASRMPPEVH